jgi:hypothetical protein
VHNNPIRYKDPTGHVIDTVLDVGFLLYDAGSAVYHAAKGDEEALKEDLVALAVDAACTLIPGATGGGLAARGAMKAGKEVVKRKAATEIAQQTVTKGGKIVKEGVEQLSKKAAKKAETLSKNVSEATHEHHSFPKFLTGDVAKQGAKGGIGGFKPSQLMDNALLKFNKEGLTNAGRALSKHPAIVGESKQTFNTVYRTVEAQNKAATNFLNNLLKEGNGTIIDNTRWGKLIEYRNSNGLGARWTTGGKFIGFVD